MRNLLSIFVLFAALSAHAAPTDKAKTNHKKLNAKLAVQFGKTWFSIVRVMDNAERRQSAKPKHASTIYDFLIPSALAAGNKTEGNNCLRAGNIGTFAYDSKNSLYCKYKSDVPKPKPGYEYCNPNIFPGVGEIKRPNNDKYTMACANIYVLNQWKKVYGMDASAPGGIDDNQNWIDFEKLDPSKPADKKIIEQIGNDVAGAIILKSDGITQKTNDEIKTEIGSFKEAAEFSCPDDLIDPDLTQCKQATDNVVALNVAIKTGLEKATLVENDAESPTKPETPNSTKDEAISVQDPSCDPTKEACRCTDPDSVENPLVKLRNFGRNTKNPADINRSCFSFDSEKRLLNSFGNFAKMQNGKGEVTCRINCDGFGEKNSDQFLITLHFEGNPLGSKNFRIESFNTRPTKLSLTNTQKASGVPATVPKECKVNGVDYLNLLSDTEPQKPVGVFLSKDNIGLGVRKCFYSRTNAEKLEEDVKTWVMNNGKGPKKRRLIRRSSSIKEYEAPEDDAQAAQ